MKGWCSAHLNRMLSVLKASTVFAQNSECWFERKHMDRGRGALVTNLHSSYETESASEAGGETCRKNRVILLATAEPCRVSSALGRKVTLTRAKIRGRRSSERVHSVKVLRVWAVLDTH